MQLRFNSIKIHNFMSFENAEIDLTSIGYTLVRGINNNKNDSAQSNGSGKSTIFESIVWCLTGQTIRNTKDVVNNVYKKDCIVELNFNCDNNSYRVIRTKEHTEFGNNLFIYINDKDISAKGIRDSEKVLKQYLPDLTPELIGSVIVLGQGLPQRFTSNTPSGRKEILEKLSKSDFMIEDIKNRVSKRKEELSADLKEVETESVKLETLKEQNFDSLDLKEDDLNYIQNNENSIEKLEERLIAVNSDISIQEENVKSREKEQEIINKKIEELRENYREKLNQQNKHKQEINDKYNELIGEHKVKFAKLEAKWSSLEYELKKLESITDVCPTCGQKIQGIEKPDTSGIKKEIDEVKINYNAQKIAIEDLEEQHKKEISDIDEAYMQELGIIQSLGELEKNKLSDINEKIDKVKNLIISLKTEKSEILLNIDNIKNKKEKLISEIETLKKSTKEIEEKLLYIYNKENNLNEHIQVNTKMNTLIARDFRGVLLSNVIDFLNSRAKEYTKYVFKDISLKFVLEGNNLNIIYNDKYYESLSGGERQRLDIIIQFLLRDMLCTLMNFSSNILIADECFDGLDALGCSKIIDLISNINDIESIYIVTHHDDLNIPFDRQLTVIKGNDGISKILQ